MAVITPQTDVYLLKCPLEISDINQLTFANATAQHNYFNSLPKIGVDNFTYQRKDGTIRYGANFDSLLGYNYVMYRNDAFSNKWFYAFITGMEYLNDNVTAIAIKTDVWQTYQFDLNFKPVLIDREHTNNDTIGANTYPEGLELGEMVCNGDVTNFGTDSSGIGDWVIVVDVSMIENPGDNQTLKYTGDPPVQYINGIPSGLYHLVLGVNASVVISPRDIINLYDEAGLSDAVQNVYILPRGLIGDTTMITLATQNVPNPRAIGVYMPNSSTGVANLGTWTCPRPSSIRGFVPKNNKLFVYPYNYVNVSNNAGTVIPYHYEDFSGDVSFKVEGVLTPSGSVKAVPQNYKYVTSSENAYDYSISGAKYPICGWTTDSYTNWLTQNAVNMQHQWAQAIIGGGVQGLQTTWDVGSQGGGMAGGMTGAGIGLIQYASGLIGTALEQHRAKSQANLAADQSRGNANAGDIVWSKLRARFTFMPMSIKPEYAYKIDEFFSQFGYKTNRVKVPNITGRRNWNYVKTVGCYIEADIPQDDLAEIKAMFDNGITLWHNPATFADYSQNNDII